MDHEKLAENLANKATSFDGIPELKNEVIKGLLGGEHPFSDGEKFHTASDYIDMFGGVENAIKAAKPESGFGKFVDLLKSSGFDPRDVLEIMSRADQIMHSRQNFYCGPWSILEMIYAPNGLGYLLDLLAGSMEPTGGVIY